jgi:putative thiamine transport system ATP-binding protein
VSGLTLKGVVLSLHGHPLLSLDLAIAPGEIVTVMGPSGSGKSTLLRYLAGALPAGFRATGEVLLDGVSLGGLPPEKRRLGLLFQDDLLFPHLSVGGNLLFALPQASGKAMRRARVEAALGEAGLAGFFDRDPATLSGGQRARVALLRVLACEPRALLLDEPFSKLDSERRHQVQELVFGEARRRLLPTLMVTHDHADAVAAGGRILPLG